MGLESTPTKLADLNAAWPLSTDDPKYGDDHLRNIKTVIKNLDTATAEVRGRLVSVQKFTADGTWTRPTGVRYIVVKGKGQGGGGAGGAGGVGYGAGGGGGEGGYCEKFIDVTAISSVAVQVGSAAGGGGSYSATNAPTNGTDGEDTTFGAHFTAGGGKGGKADGLTAGAQYGVGGAGGAATNGDINLPGDCGQGNKYTSAGVPTASGAGGGNGGGAPILASAAGTGNAGAANSGGGGSGGMYVSTPAGNGGAGGSGFVVVYEYT